MQAATKTTAIRAPDAAYIVQLDALRAFAVAAVMVHHYVPGGWPSGAYQGVKLFFTISGFLITGILLRARQEAESKGLRRIGALGRFYARRCLRIFPLYYFVVVLALAINLEPARKLAGWLLTYTFNIHMAHQGWFEDTFAHFWSLSVEEQFYICWPWLTLFLPRKGLIPAAVAMILTGPLYRGSYILSGYQNMSALSTYISTLSCVDSLGAGALLAMVMHGRLAGAETLRRWSRIVLPIGIAAEVAMALWADSDVRLLARDWVQALVFCSLICATTQGVRGAAGRVLEWKPLLYMGKISYGLYVYHPLIPALCIWLIVKLTGITLQERSWQLSTLATVLTLAIASASWQFMERPLNNLKRRF